MSEIKQGWAVQISRKDGSTFLASSGTGNVSAVWAKCNRKWAALHKKDCVVNGFKCKVVPVEYTEPVVVVEKPQPKCLCGHARSTHGKHECQAGECDCICYRANERHS